MAVWKIIERALERFLFGIYSRIDRYFERFVRSGTKAEENLPDLGTYVETCYHGGSLIIITETLID